MSNRPPVEAKKRDQKAEFPETVVTKEARKLRARREGDRGVWFGFGMFGLVGWAVSIPTVIGVAAGVWIDKTWPSSYSWTLMCLIFGVLIGCFNAWYWIKRESRKR
ncbi:MAG: AtpZ/AtpI family protein [Deltaproteobacteria bacterium]|nr:AtpZ/AtpI family protein [Deltaproteobacteria bacterium]